MKLEINLKERSYDILIQKGSLESLHQYVNLQRKIMVVTDEGVPKKLLKTVMDQCPNGFFHVMKQGEENKTLAAYESILRALLEAGFTRHDAVIALGGGVVGDVSGFAAASYMRGIDFINIPTTTLSQIDSAIGGKTAVNLDGVKNIVGAFYQPKFVLIDPVTLRTLPEKEFFGGLVEALKAGLIADKALYELFLSIREKNMEAPLLEEILLRALTVKKKIVEEDEKEEDQRALLNFGHTIGHGIEGLYGKAGFNHGECVALGMLPMIEDNALRKETEEILCRLGLRTKLDYDVDAVFSLIQKDKKGQGKTIRIVTVKEAGQAKIKEVPFETIKEILMEERS